jgi:ubiquinone/menaquinone biosynthesis C-methylase UbiE
MTAHIRVDVEVARLTNLPRAAATFDVVVVGDTEGLMASVPWERRRSVVGEIFRVLKPDGRVVAIGQQPRGGMLGALIAKTSPPLVVDLKQWLEAEGFESVRLLAGPGDLAVVEGIKPPSR